MSRTTKTKTSGGCKGQLEAPKHSTSGNKKGFAPNVSQNPYEVRYVPKGNFCPSAAGGRLRQLKPVPNMNSLKNGMFPAAAFLNLSLCKCLSKCCACSIHFLFHDAQSFRLESEGLKSNEILKDLFKP